MGHVNVLWQLLFGVVKTCISWWVSKNILFLDFCCRIGNLALWIFWTYVVLFSCIILGNFYKFSEGFGEC